MLFHPLSVVYWSWNGGATHVLVSFSSHDSIIFAEGFSCCPLSGGQISERQLFLVIEAVAPVVPFEIVQAIFYLGMTFRGNPLFANVESRDVSDSGLFSGRVVVVVGDAAHVPPESLHCFVGVVGRSWPRWAELEPLAQEGPSSCWDLGFFAKIVVGGIGRASLVVSGGHLAVVIFVIQPCRRTRVGAVSMGIFHI